MQLMTPIVLTVANDPKYLVLLQEPIHDIEEKQPELPITSGDDVDSDPNQRRISRIKISKTSSYRASLRENDVILFVGKTNVEKLTHENIKVMIRAAALASNQIALTVISKLDIPEYKTLQEKGLID
ncbi:unnamed protein product [Adineta steineri]|nr:unnamed protein product [Adineta steineri]